jgi:hypothetical protein
MVESMRIGEELYCLRWILLARIELELGIVAWWRRQENGQVWEQQKSENVIEQSRQVGDDVAALGGLCQVRKDQIQQWSSIHRNLIGSMLVRRVTWPSAVKSTTSNSAHHAISVKPA